MRIGYVAVAPVGAATARLTIRKSGTSGANADSWLFVCRAQFEQVGATATGPGPWSPPGVDARHVNALLAPSIANAGTIANWSGVADNDGNRPTNGATVGATWGSNIASQPADAALLNALQTWAQVSGTGRPADNATVGATWGSNIASQPADAALLNALQTWAQVSGTGRPADNATVNVVTYSSTEPSSTNGDIWFDTTTTPFTIKARVAGAWQIGANLSTGALAQLHSVDTAQITAGAVTSIWDFSLLAGPYTRTNIA